QAASSAWQAGTSVSGTYWPPKGPNLPRVIGLADGADERPHQVRVLDPQPGLDPARNVHPIRLEPAHDPAHVNGIQAAGDEDKPARQQRAGELPVPGPTRAATLVGRPGIEHHRVGPIARAGDGS